MKIKNAGRGIHQREIPGIDRLRALPPDWYAFTNLELAVAQGQSREVDVIMVIEDRILLIDLKDWHGRIASTNGRWTQNGRDRGPSPVEKVRENARKFGIVLQQRLEETARRQGRRGERIRTPFMQGWVLLSGRANIDNLAENERSSVLFLEEFMRKCINSGGRNALLGPAPWIDREHPLTGSDGHWRQILGSFFNIQTGPFHARQRAYGGFRAVSDDTTFRHPEGIYSEYDAEQAGDGRTPGLLRVWDFSKADTRYQSEEGRLEIAGRERLAIDYLNDRNPEFEGTLLQPRDSDLELSVSYWEVFERRRRLVRLAEAAGRGSTSLPDAMRLDMARSLLAKAKAMHDLGAAHLDFGAHSIWLEEPSTVKLSHLLATSFPNLDSLGVNRFRFLATGAKLPEDCFDEPSDNFRRDVFLLGCAIHHLLLGVQPAALDESSPPDWNPSVDVAGRYESLHDWFATALAWSAEQRFADAGAMLEAFNAAFAQQPSGRDVVAGLARFRVWNDQFELFEKLPPLETIKRTDRVMIYASEHEGVRVIVKLWRRAAWGDDRAEAPRILAFLEQAADLANTPVPGVCRVIDMGFLGDAIVLVQAFEEGHDLARCLSDEPDRWVNSVFALGFVRRLAEIVDELHMTGFAHGDLKPSNIVVSAAPENAPVIIDLLEFGPADEGEILTTAYAPPAGGSRLERDRFAVTRICEEICSACELPGNIVVSLAKAIETCRSGPPANATLLPLIETIDAALAPPKPARPRFTVSLVGERSGQLLPDEGRFGIRVQNRFKPPSLIIRGATEEIELKISDSRHFVSARCRLIDQGHISRVAKHEIHYIEADINVEAGPINAFAELEFLLEEPTISSALAEPDVAPALEEPDLLEAELDDDAALDAIVEVAATSPPSTNVDIPVLWRSLIDVEQELFTEGTADGDSAYRRDRRRHVLPFELERGAFDFARYDKVIVERPRRKGDGWQEIGLLDVEASTPTTIVVDTSGRTAFNPSGPIIREGDRLRFKSLMETYSRTRRETATSRIVEHRSVIPKLIDFFDTRTGSAPMCRPIAVDRAGVAETYGLNPNQVDAFVDLLGMRPLGLLQGPPGTGKTKFIGSFVHYALTQGLVRNVLLASQSHEAVNNAGEAVLKLFRQAGSEPSLVRVGQEGSVSDELRPFQAERVETQFKDRFKAELTERLKAIGERLGLDPALTERLVIAETALLPVVDRLHAVGEIDPDAIQRADGLARTAETIASKIGLSAFGAEEWRSEAAYGEFVSELARRHGASESQVGRLRAVAKLARDWSGSISTHQRSFETFLAGTRSIVAGTCVGLGRSALGLTDTRFDLAIIDEAARCTASELAVPMQAARWILLVGDHRQLEPHHRPDVVAAVQFRTRIPGREILRSDFDRVFASTYGTGAGRTLTVQYRMLPPIGRVVSAAFYASTLTHGRTEPVIPASLNLGDLDHPLTWVETDSLGTGAYQRRSEGRSLINDAEADAIIGLLRRLDQHSEVREWFRSQQAYDKPIGIICTYAAQRDLIKRRLVASGLDALMRDACKVDTVDSYQGKENPIVILSLVRNNADGAIEHGAATIQAGFMQRPNRINVAISRAMDRLVIVGARRRWRSGTPMADVTEAFDSELAAGHARVLTSSEVSIESKSIQPKKSANGRKAIEVTK